MLRCSDSAGTTGQLRAQPANHRGGNAAMEVEDEDKASRMWHLLQVRDRRSIEDSRGRAEIQTAVSDKMAQDRSIGW